MPDRFRTAWAATVTVAGLAIVAYFTALDGPIATTVIYEAFGIGAAVSILVGVRLHRPRHRQPWYLLALAMALLAAGDLWYSLYDVVWHTEVPYPSPADVPYLLGFLAVAVSLVLFSRRRFPGRDVASVLDSLILATSSALLAWVYLMAPYAQDDSLSILQRLVSVAYPAADVLFVGLAIRLAIVPGRQSLAVRIMLVASLTWVVTDMIYGVQVLNGDYVSGSAIDAGWLLGYLGWAIAALHPSMRSLTEPSPPRAVSLSSSRIAALASASLVAPALLFVQATTDSVREVHVFAATAALLFLLVVARLSGVASQLNEAAAHDALTRLPNRTQLMEALAAAIRDLRADDRSLAVLFMDLDRFKQVNDTLGHAAGDELLCVMAERVRSVVGPDALPARLGGDEFVVLQPRADLALAVTLAEDLERALSEPVRLHDTPFFLSASIGVALVDDPDEDATTVLQNADLAMYRAKQRGKARWEIYDGTSMSHGARTRLERELRDALEHDQIEIWFEPIVDMDTSSVRGVEALVRWNHPERGVLAPSDFLDIAEETGLIVSVGAHVIATACEWAHRWQEVAPGLRLFVNVSERQLLQADLVATVRAALESSGLRANHLVIEISEHVVAAAYDDAAPKLAALRDDGVRVALDDFGTGASSVASLRYREVDYVKLDRVMAITSPNIRRDRAVMSGLAAMARDAEFVLVAEGVETFEQVAALRESGIRLGQGHLFGKAMPAGALDDRLRAAPTRS